MTCKCRASVKLLFLYCTPWFSGLEIFRSYDAFDSFIPVVLVLAEVLWGESRQWMKQREDLRGVGKIKINWTCSHSKGSFHTHSSSWFLWLGENKDPTSHKSGLLWICFMIFWCWQIIVFYFKEDWFLKCVAKTDTGTDWAQGEEGSRE